jgi:iron complex transport system ATP-binding protein
MIQISHVDFSYHTSPVLRDVTCHIRRGSFVAIVGPNGSGKSTLIKCICNLLKIRRGTILVDGLPSEKYRADRLARMIAYIPQKENENQPVTVFDTVLSGRKPYIRWKPSPRDYDEVADVLRKLHIEHLAMRHIDQLSGGQQQIVMIARALAQKTPILLLDEPIANLDIRHQLEVMELLRTLSDSGMTVVISIHDLNIAVRYTDNLVMLKQGHVFAQGNRDILTPENIRRLYHINARIINAEGFPCIIPSRQNQSNP